MVVTKYRNLEGCVIHGLAAFERWTLTPPGSTLKCVPERTDQLDGTKGVKVLVCTQVKGEIDPPGNHDAAEVPMCDNHNITSVQAFILVLSVVIPNLMKGSEERS